MSLVMQVEGLGKEYRYGVINRRMLYEDVQSWWARLRGREDPNARIKDLAHPLPGRPGDRFWALRDVGFEVCQGDVLGIIGRNGAGKSTLLKILSQITAPTTGRVRIRGRVASLLEVGTGFHPELTGRENIFLNGAILGMSRREVVSKYDEIAAFSGVDQFLETPVKRYSSGMRVRLAFAVAAHLDPEILIMDEVLAVGDAAFQSKCLGKLGEVAREGRTVLFVSHNMAAIQNLCTRGIVLQDGAVHFQGNHMEAITHYLSTVEDAGRSLAERADREGRGGLRIVQVGYRSAEGRSVGIANAGQDLEIVLSYACDPGVTVSNARVQITVATQFEVPVFSHFNTLSGENFAELAGSGRLVCRIPSLPLPPGMYQLGFAIRGEVVDVMLLDSVRHAADLRVEGGDFFGTGRMPSAKDGLVLVKASWRVET